MIVVGGLAVDQNRVLMGLRPMGKLRPCMWEYPGGKVDPGESPIEALRREWKEELGVDVTVGELITVVQIRVEVELHWTLYHVEICDHAQLQTLAHDRLLWNDPLYAIQHLPCTPTTYLSYRRVVAHLGRLS
jgi:8-oxo-dGTP diphosphatase